MPKDSDTGLSTTILSLDSFYDRPLTKPAIYVTNVSRLADTRKDAIKKKSSCILLFWKGISIDGVGVARGTVFQGIGCGASFKPAISLKKKFGGVYRRTRPY